MIWNKIIIKIVDMVVVYDTARYDTVGYGTVGYCTVGKGRW